MLILCGDVQGAAEGVGPNERPGAAGETLHRAGSREGYEGGTPGEDSAETGHTAHTATSTKNYQLCGSGSALWETYCTGISGSAWKMQIRILEAKIA